MISLPLAKLSTAQDDSADAKQLSWKHDSRDLSVVIDTFGARDRPSQLLKVIQGLQVLHLIEVERLVNDGKDLIRTMKEHGIELKSEQLPISALVRCPLLAIRWQLQNQKVRRIQLRFKSSQDFDTIFNHLNQLGLRLSPANESGSRSSESNSNGTAPLPTSSPPRPPGSATSSRSTDRGSRPYSALAAPTALEAQLQEAAHLRPMSANPWRHGNSEAIPAALPGPLKPPEFFVRPDSANSASLGSFDEAFSSAPSAQLMRSPEMTPEFTYERPGTALLYDRPGTAEALLPPRRELPFARTSLTLSSGSDRPSSRPSTALMGPPPLPARVSSLRPHSSRVPDQVNELPELPKPTVLDSPMQQPSWMQQAAIPLGRDKGPSHHGQGEGQKDKESWPISGTNLASSPVSGKHASPFTNPLVRPLSGLNDTTKNTRRPDTRSSLSTPPASDVHQYRPAPENSPTTPSPNHISDDLAKYLMQSTEGRRAALNEFIFQCLEDENFIALVEDMETCYSRIGVNMK